MKRSLIAALLLAPLAILHAADVLAKKPNILLVLTDDQGYGDFPLHRNPLLKTPNLDRFAREGLRFEQFQVSPFCSPTRASLLTGRYSLRTGVTSVTNNKEVMRPQRLRFEARTKVRPYMKRKIVAA